MIYYASRQKGTLTNILNSQVRALHRSLRTGSTVIWDLHEVENGINQQLFDKVHRHLTRDPTSQVIVNLSDENIPVVPNSVQVYTDFIQQWRPQQVEVWCSQPDALAVLAQQNPGIRTREVSHWEHATAHHRQLLEHPQIHKYTVPTHRLVSLNRRYHPLRAQLIYSLWSRRQQLNYTLGSGDPWGAESDEEFQQQEWQDLTLKPHVMAWQQTCNPWRQLSCDITEWEYDHTWNFTSTADICVVVESRHSKFPRNDAFITEKTFRPIAMGKPIIVCGQPSAIQTLQRWGYQTINTHSDIQHVIKTAQHILDLSNDEYQQKLQGWQVTAQQNQQRFLQRTSPSAACGAAQKAP